MLTAEASSESVAPLVMFTKDLSGSNDSMSRMVWSVRDAVLLVAPMSSKYGTVSIDSLWSFTN